MGTLVCAACGQPVELTFDDEYQHDTTDAELACREYPVIPARPAGYYLERGN